MTHFSVNSVAGCISNVGGNLELRQTVVHRLSERGIANTALDWNVRNTPSDFFF
jgi:hypothetical protein